MKVFSLPRLSNININVVFWIRDLSEKIDQNLDFTVTVSTTFDGIRNTFINARRKSHKCSKYSKNFRNVQMRENFRPVKTAVTSVYSDTPPHGCNVQTN